MERLLSARIRDLYAKDRACPLAYEPSGQDFLSPCLAEADLMRRLLAPPAFAGWLLGFLPGDPGRRRRRLAARRDGDGSRPTASSRISTA